MSSLLTQALQCILLLYTLFCALKGEEVQAELHLECPTDVQRQCATAMQTDLEPFLSVFREEAEQNAKPSKSRSARQPPRRSMVPGSAMRSLQAGLRLCSLSPTYVTAIRVGALDVKYSATLFRYYAQFNSDYDALCHDLVTVLRDDALHAGRAWVVCETIIEALKQVRGATYRRVSKSICCTLMKAVRRILSRCLDSSQMRR